MKTRIVLASTALLAISFATASMARPGEPPKAQAPAPAESRATLRPIVARLRAEVELLQLDHEGDVLVMKDLIKGLKFLDAMGAGGSLESLLEETRKKVGVALPVFPQIIGNPPAQTPEETAKLEAVVDEASAKMLRKIYEQTKQGFVDRTTALNQKQLELMDLEIRMNAAP